MTLFFPGVEMTTNELTLQGHEYLKVPRSTARLQRGAGWARNGSHQGGITSSSSLVTDPWPSGWLAAEGLKRPFPPSRLKAQVRNCVTHCFLRRTFRHFCQGPWTGGWLPRPGRSPGTCRPQPHGWPLPEGFGPAQHIVGTHLSEEGGGGRPGAPGLPLPLRAPPTAEKQGLFQPQSSHCLWASWVLGLPASTAHSTALTTAWSVRSSIWHPKIQMGRPHRFHLGIRWNGEMLLENSTFSYVQTHCACLSSFGKPFPSPFQ